MRPEALEEWAEDFLDRRLYLPREWCADRLRRRAAKVPDEVRFQTKPELAIAMLEHAWLVSIRGKATERGGQIRRWPN